MFPDARKTFKILFIFASITVFIFLSNNWNVKEPNYEGQVKNKSDNGQKVDNLPVDMMRTKIDETVHMSRLPKEGFQFVKKDADSRFFMKSTSCRVPEWNQVHTNVIPNAKLHDMWMAKNISRNNYLYHSTPSPFAAFVYEEYIAVTLSSENKFSKKMYCRYFDCKGNEIPDTFESVVFPESTVYCGRRIGAEFISITEKIDDVPEAPVRIQNRNLQIPQHYFTVCVAALYGDEPKFLQIVDFVEYYKLQGATFIHVYVQNATFYDRKLLEDYQRTGDIEVIYLHDHYWRADFMWHMMQINDCHMRSKNFAKWTAFVDLDERIEMKKENTRIVDLLDTVDDPNVNNLHFSVQWVLKDKWSPVEYVNDTQLTQEMLFKKFHNSSRIAQYWFQPKCIVRPERVGVMTIHLPLVVYRGFQKTYIEDKVACVRHYRNTDGGSLINNNKRAFEFGPYRNTNVAPWIEQKLTKQILKRVKSVYEIVNYNCTMMQEMYHIHGLEAACYTEEHRKWLEWKKQQDEEEMRKKLEEGVKDGGEGTNSTLV